MAAPAMPRALDPSLRVRLIGELQQQFDRADLHALVKDCAGVTLEYISTADGLRAIVPNVVDWFVQDAIGPRALVAAAARLRPRSRIFADLLESLDRAGRTGDPYERLDRPPGPPRSDLPPPRELKITIDSRAKRRWSASEPKDGGPIAAGSGLLPVKTAQLLQRHYNLGSLGEEDLKILGEHLFHILFAPSSETEPKSASRRSALHALKNQLDDIAAGKHPSLRITLAFSERPEARELALLPWECLYIPDGAITFDDDEVWPERGFFLANGHPSVSLARTPAKTKTLDPCDPPLSVLLIDAREPKGDGQPAWWRAPVDDGAIELHTLEQPTLEALKAALHPNDHRRRPHVIHFVGRASMRAPKPGDEPMPSLSLRSGERAWVGIDELWDYIKDADTRLVMLQAVPASEGTSSDYMTLMHAAAYLIVRECPGVVAMQYGAKADEFSAAFYRAINGGSYIDFALRTARNTLDQRRGEFGNPVLFLQALGKIVDENRRAPASRLEGQTRPSAPVTPTTPAGPATEQPTASAAAPPPGVGALFQAGGSR